MDNIRALVNNIDLNEFNIETFQQGDYNIIPNSKISSNFNIDSSVVELHIYDINFNLLKINNEVKNSWIINSQDNTLELKPIQDLINCDYDLGYYILIYNFIQNELSSSYKKKLFIKEISASRTEIILNSNLFTLDENLVNVLKNKLTSDDYFDEFYLVYNNIYITGINILYNNGDLLIKLYEPLPSNIETKDELYIVTKTLDSLGYEIIFQPNIENFERDIISIKGPNFGLNINDNVNNSTKQLTISELKNSKSENSENYLSNILNEKGIKLTPYGGVLCSQPDTFFNNFSNFIHFSSAEHRILNFIKKVEILEGLNNDKKSLKQLGNSESIKNNIISIKNKINNIIRGFDRYENYLYYGDTEKSYPKQDGNFPYKLQPLNSNEVINWLGSPNEEDQYYGGILKEANKYDCNNPNWLLFSIPEYLRDNIDNTPYISFCNMVGQAYDEIWLYIKFITEKYKNINSLYEGIPLDIVKSQIESLGFQIFNNNYINEDTYIGLAGENNGSYVPPLEQEILSSINHYIAVNLGYSLFYWQEYYGDDGEDEEGNYVEQLFKKGCPYPIDDVKKEIYKRIFHNITYLFKKKGTQSGLRNLINIWGINPTILRISEFGNRDKNYIWDHYYYKYNYKFNMIPKGEEEPKAEIIIPWESSYQYYLDNDEFVLPSNIQFRFKTNKIPLDDNTQYLLVKKTDNLDFGITLEYVKPIDNIHIGSPPNEFKNYGYISFFIKDNNDNIIHSDPIYLPFFNNEWWSVELSKDSISILDEEEEFNLELKVGQKENNNITNNTIKWLDDINLVIESPYWNTKGEIFLGGELNNQQFSGSFQELRYFGEKSNENQFNNYIMNPLSVEDFDMYGDYGNLIFRADLGSKLDGIFSTEYSYLKTPFKLGNNYFNSIHSNINTPYFDTKQCLNYYITNENLTVADGQEILINNINPSLVDEIEIWNVDVDGNTNKQLITKIQPNSILKISYGFIDIFYKVISKPQFIEENKAFISVEYLNGGSGNLSSRTLGEICIYPPGAFIDSDTLLPSNKYNIKTEVEEGDFITINTEIYYINSPTTGVKDRISEVITIENNLNYEEILSPHISIEQNHKNKKYNKSLNSVEVGFSFQNELNDNIINSLENKKLYNFILGEDFEITKRYYEGLRGYSKKYFRKFHKTNPYDYLRLIKFYDNSLFKTIKNFIPARTSISTGIIIKQHLLERNKHDIYSPEINNVNIYGELYNPVIIKGGPGGSVNKYNKIL